MMLREHDFALRDMVHPAIAATSASDLTVFHTWMSATYPEACSDPVSWKNVTSCWSMVEG